ncbi:MAG: ABC transporter permease [Gemmatimonadetes bacterium]|nr:ABC transporter permease [Gemmatimonadota bacterium]
MRELCHAIRRLRRRPLRGGALGVTLAVGIGAATAAFAAFDSVILQRLPVADEDRLVVVWQQIPERGSLPIPFRASAFDAAARGAASLTGVAGISAWGALPVPVGEGDEGFSLHQARTVGDFFGVLGVLPTVGRLTTADDDAPGAEPVVVLSYAAWRDRYEADPDVVGRVMLLDGEPVTIVGVGPPGLDFPLGTDLWSPLRHDFGGDPGFIELHVVGRMADGVDAGVVGADIRAALAGARLEGAPEGWPTVVRPFDDLVRGPVRPMARAALWAAALLLLAATANATFLLMVGGRGVAQEHAIRHALGAGRARLFARFVADGVLVGTLATGGGLVVAWLTLRQLASRVPPEVPRLDLLAIDGRAVGFAFALGLLAIPVTAALATLVVWVRRPPGLLTTNRHGSTRGTTLRRGVAALQIGLTVVSAMGAGLLLRTVAAMDRLDAGMAAEDITAVSLRVPYGWFEVPEHYFQTLESVASSLEAHPEIAGARPSLGPPLQQRLEVVLTAEDQGPGATDRNPYVAVDAVLPGHFEALGIPLLAGRDLTQADNRLDADPVVVVDQVLAEALWPGGDPLGKRVSGLGPAADWYTVVGIAAATRYREYLEPHPRAYFPLRRLAGAPPSALLVRAEAGAKPPIASLVREDLARLDPEVQVLGAQRLSDALRAPTMGRRFAAAVLGSFALATILLALVGVYGVFAVSVQERVAEMGVRKALGARATDIAFLVLRGILRVAVVGVVAGFLVSLWTARLVESLLYGVQALDGRTFAAVTILSLSVATAAGLVPALRASRTDPARSIRSE